MRGKKGSACASFWAEGTEADDKSAKLKFPSAPRVMRIAPPCKNTVRNFKCPCNKWINEKRAPALSTLKKVPC